MKTKYFFTLIFFCVFAIANAQDSSLGTFITLERTGTVFSPNGEWMAKTINHYIDPATGSAWNGGAYVFHKNASGYNYTQTAVYTLPKGQGADSEVVIHESQGVAINNNGDVFNCFEDDVDGEIATYKIYKNGTQIDSTYGLGPYAMYANNNAMYVFLVNAVTNTRILRKYDANSGAFIWETNFASSYAIKILGTETSNIYVQMNDGRLIEIDPANGAILGTPVTPTAGHSYGAYPDFYQINTNNVVERYDAAAKKLITESGETNWINPTYGVWNFWDNYNIKSWKKINDKIYGFAGAENYVLSSDLKHGYMKPVFQPENNERFSNYYIHDDASITYITTVFDCNSCTYGQVYAKHYTFPTPIPVPNVDGSQPEIESVYNGQSFNRNSSSFTLVNDYERVVTLVLNDSDMLAEDERAPTVWFPQPSDVTDLYVEKVQVDADGNLFFRVVYYIDELHQHNLYVKIISHSALSTDDEVVKDVASLGYYNPREESFIVNPEMNIIGGVVYDVVGKKIKNFSRENIFLGDVSDGVYILKAQDTQGNFFTNRLLKN